MAVLVAIRHNPVIARFDACARVALVAGRRKLLTILNAMLRERRPWSPAAS
jgi:transposase